MQEITSSDIVLARHIREDDIKEGLSFFSSSREYIQAGTWNYGRGKVLPAHMHNTVEREVPRTYEVLYIISGSIRAAIYDPDERQVDTITVNKGEILMLLEGGHGYEILEDGTKVLEVKNGPYPGAEADRRRLAQSGGDEPAREA